MGVVGPAISNLIAFTVYNFIRCVFLYRKLNMQPFTIKTLYTILLAAAGFMICYLLFKDKIGLEWIMIRSVLFILLFGTGTFLLKLTPDLFHVIETVKGRMRRNS